MSIIEAAFMLFMVMDSLGSIPVFLSTLKNIPTKKRFWVICREMMIALTILSLFLFFGTYILHGLELTPAAMSITGGFLLIIIALRMIFPQSKFGNDAPADSEPFIVPLAVPMIAGPASIAMVMLINAQYPHHTFKWFISLTIAWIASSLVLISSDFLRQILREKGLIALERLMGMILVAMSMQMLLNGIKSFFHC